ncbi:hypothetical protein FLACHUCJ7_00230 [Flavobacterium chungangense]|uniref:Uncharacterized protein n=1 Tax=Flavobacterium chungangense TaxID=554283 RepID=A0A6V6YQ26_9FLAO|nr:hypothetical protein FLACHUCJ7_00230 [Flavobacterium chungangense]
MFPGKAISSITGLTVGVTIIAVVVEAEHVLESVTVKI